MGLPQPLQHGRGTGDPRSAPSPPSPQGTLLSSHPTYKSLKNRPPEGHKHQRPRRPCQKRSSPELSAELPVPQRPRPGDGLPLFSMPSSVSRHRTWIWGGPQALSPREAVAIGGLSWPSEEAQPGLWSVPTVGRRTTVPSSPHDVVLSWHGPAEAAAPDSP